MKCFLGRQASAAQITGGTRSTSYSFRMILGAVYFFIGCSIGSREAYSQCDPTPVALGPNPVQIPNTLFPLVKDGHFGSSVAISGNGDFILVGAPEEGRQN